MDPEEEVLLNNDSNNASSADNEEKHVVKFGMSQDEKWHQCEQCDYNTTRIGNLQRHIRAKHDGQRNFKCHLCGKAFAEKQTLQKHMQKVCQKEGSSTASQNNH